MNTATDKTVREVIERLKFGDYLKLPGVHSSELKNILVSPLLYAHRQLQPKNDTDVLREGRAGHTGILEPQRLLAEYAEYDTVHTEGKNAGKKRNRSGKAWADFLSANTGKTILTPSQFANAIALRDAVRDHPVAGPLFKGIGRNELSIRWTDTETGLVMKARPDRLTAEALIDVKTTADPTPRAFGNIATRMYYFMQLALYSDGVEAVFGVTPAVKIVAVQKTAPYDVVVYDLEHEELEYGRAQYRAALRRLVECRKANQWPGFAVDGSIPLKLPGWMLSLGEDSEPISFGEDVIQ